MEESQESKSNTVVVESPSQSSDLNKSEVNDTKAMDEAPSRSKDLSKTLPEEAFNNFIQGKRHMLVQDYTFAVQSLAIACEMYVKHFGELALECGEVYFLYGKALIRLSQQQSGVIGDAINKAAPVIEDDDEEGDSSEEDEKENGNESGEDKEKEKENEKNGSAPEDNEVESEEKEPSESTDSPQTVDNNEVKEVEKEAEPNESAAEVSIQNETATEEPQEPEEDDLELAWNSLETAKTIFSRQNDKESQLKIAEILQLLAEISMETDNYPAAINDLKSCLCIQRTLLAPDDRLLAHTYYEMGLAHMLQKMYDGALDNFTKTLEIFQLKRDNLEKTPIPETIGGFEAADRQKELEDIDGIITDIREKIEDTKELVRNAKNELQEAIMKKEKEIEIDFGKPETTENSAKPVSNITHLLKRKKPDEEEKDSESKRIKLSNGDTTVSK